MPDTFPAKYTGYEYLRADTAFDGMMGWMYLEYPGIKIQDEKGNSLLTQSEGNLRDNDFQFIHEGKIFRKGDCLPGFIPHETFSIGYNMHTPVSNESINWLSMGRLDQSFEGISRYWDYEFVWPEKKFKMYLRVYQERRRIKVPENHRYAEHSDSATVYLTGMFVNGRIDRDGSPDYAILQSNSNGTVEIIHPRR